MNEDQTEPENNAADRYRALFDNSADSIFIIENSKFVECNQAAVELFGYSDKQALMQRHPSELSPEYQSDGKRSVDKADEFLANITNVRSQRFEWDHVKADGSPLPVEVSMTAIPMGEKYTLHIVLRDISERRRLEKELRHSQKMESLGHLAGGIAHDFNNTLVPIVTYSDLLTHALADRPDLKEWAQEIGRAGKLAASMVKKLLAVSRQNDRLPVRMDLEDAVRGASGMLRKLIGEDINVELRPTGSPLFIETDPGDVEHILLNLASNSRDALPTGGNIQLILSKVQQSDRPFARLEFSDDGVGMDASTLEQIFAPFFTTKALGSGTGLGMSSVYELVTKANGQVSASSSPGEGTTIEILFPIVDSIETESDSSDHASYDQPTAEEATENAHVLVVEDDVQIRRLMHDLLVKRGYRVSTASNGVEALEMIERSMPDLILSDVVMPKMSGPRMIRELNAKGIFVPVVLVSGYTDDRLAAHGFDAKSVSLIHKPFTAGVLLARVRDALTPAQSESGPSYYDEA